jgi:hypothetical protein
MLQGNSRYFFDAIQFQGRGERGKVVIKGNRILSPSKALSIISNTHELQNLHLKTHKSLDRVPNDIEPSTHALVQVFGGRRLLKRLPAAEDHRLHQFSEFGTYARSRFLQFPEIFIGIDHTAP